MTRAKLTQLAASAMVLWFASSVRSDIVVRFDAPDVTVGRGEVFDLNIVADIDEPVLGWGLDLIIADISILSTVGAPSIGPLWNSVFSPDGDGLVGIAFPDSIIGDDILLATITFSADALGGTDLFLGADDNGLTEGFPLDNVGFAGIIFESGHVNVVPVPAAGVLGMVGLAAVFWRRKRL